MEVTIEKLRKIVADVSDEEENKNKNKPWVKDSDERVEMPDKHRRLARLQGYTVHVDGHRILAVYTYCNAVAATWVREVLRCRKKKRETILVGVSVSRQRLVKLLHLCVGSQCLIFELHVLGPLPFNKLLNDPRVVSAGADMSAVAADLLRDHGIKVANVMDLNKEAAEVVVFNGQDLLKWDLDRLATAVMGRRWMVDRPVKENNWFVQFRYWFDRQLAMEKAMFATYDAYLSLVLGAYLLQKINPNKGKNNNNNNNNKHYF